MAEMFEKTVVGVKRVFQEGEMRALEADDV